MPALLCQLQPQLLLSRGQVSLGAVVLDAGRRPTVRIDPTDDTRAETVTYPEDDYSTWEPGFTVGGPIIRDRLWFFGSYIPSLQTTERTVTYLSNGETQTVRRTDRSHTSARQSGRP